MPSPKRKNPKCVPRSLSEPHLHLSQGLVRDSVPKLKHVTDQLDTLPNALSSSHNRSQPEFSLPACSHDSQPAWSQDIFLGEQGVKLEHVNMMEHYVAIKNDRRVDWVNIWKWGCEIMLSGNKKNTQ